MGLRREYAHLVILDNDSGKDSLHIEVTSSCSEWSG